MGIELPNSVDVLHTWPSRVVCVDSRASEQSAAATGDNTVVAERASVRHAQRPPHVCIYVHKAIIRPEEARAAEQSVSRA